MCSLVRTASSRGDSLTPWLARPAAHSMSSFGLRPTFEQTVPLTPEQARVRLMQFFAARVPAVEVRDFPGFIGLHIAENQRRFWSPRLFLVLDPEPAGGTIIRGTYGPEMEVWSVFLYGYLITGLLAMFSGLFGFCQWYIGQEPWGLWITGSMGVLAGLLYLGAQFGQKLGAWQTFELHQSFERAVGGPAEIH